MFQLYENPRAALVVNPRARNEPESTSIVTVLGIGYRSGRWVALIGHDMKGRSSGVSGIEEVSVSRLRDLYVAPNG